MPIRIPPITEEERRMRLIFGPKDDPPPLVAPANPYTDPAFLKAMLPVYTELQKTRVELAEAKAKAASFAPPADALAAIAAAPPASAGVSGEGTQELVVPQDTTDVANATATPLPLTTSAGPPTYASGIAGSDVVFAPTPQSIMPGDGGAAFAFRDGPSDPAPANIVFAPGPRRRYIPMRGDILPISSDADGNVSLDLTAGITGAIWDAVTFPAQVATGDALPYDMDRVMNLAGMVGLGPVGRALPKSTALPEKMESRSTNIYDPPAKPARPFEADYPAGRTPDGQQGSAVKVDIDGRPIHPGARVFGRRLVGEADQSLLPEEYDAVAKGLVGKGIATVEAGALPRRSVGAFEKFRGPDGPERSIRVLKTLPTDTAA